MRILFAYEEFVPCRRTDAEHFIHTAAALARRGHDATLVVPRENRLDDEALAAEVRAYFGVEGPLKVRTVPAFKWQKTLRHVTAALGVAAVPALRGYDLTYVQNLELMAAALEAGHRVFFDHYRPFGDQLPFLQPLLRYWMTHPNFVGAATHSAYVVDAYRRLGIPEERIEAILLGFDPNRLEPRLQRNDARRKLGLPEARGIAVYTGRINHRKGLDSVLTMARRIPEVLFILVGSTGRGPVEEEAESIDNVKIVPWQHFGDTAPYLYAADVLLMPPSGEPLRKFGRTVLPLKSFLYLAAGRAIFGADNPDIKGLLKHDENAWLVEPDDMDAAVTGLRKLLEDDSLRARLSTTAQACSRNFTWDARAERLDAFLEERMAAERVRDANDSWNPTRCATESLGWLRRGITEGTWIYRG